MAFTQEQKDANALLEQGVQAVIKAFELVPDGSMITDYLIVGEGIRFVVDDYSTTDLFIAFRNGHIRSTTALGLFDLGYDQFKASLEGDADDD